MRALRERRKAFWWPDGKHALPNLHYDWRLPVKRLSWQFAWWLMRRVVLRWMTPHGQAKMIHDALGFYRPRPPITWPPEYTTTAGNATVTWKATP